MTEVDRPGAEDGTTPELEDANLAQSKHRVLAFWEGGHRRAWLAPGAELLVGRASECDVVIDHSSVSRRHARLAAGTDVTVEDLGSSNGIRVAGTRIDPKQKVTVGPGQLVQLGSAMIVVQHPIAERNRAVRPPEQSSELERAPHERLLELVATSDIGVLLLGETGVGKNVAASQLHARSARAKQPLVRLNCAAFPEQLLEAELFGYERGAFTGAAQSKPGLIEAADGGSLLLDEIGEMPLSTQAKLLHVLDSHETQRLGSVKPKRVDVRFIAATNRDLEQAVLDRVFRRDLYFRLNGVTITIPPLRERRGEIAGLALELLAQAAARSGSAAPTLSQDVQRLLDSYDWPGNVRELGNVLERAVVLAQGGPLRPEHFELRNLLSASLSAERSATPPIPTGADLRGEVDALERQRVIETLEACGGNQTQAARRLGISRRALIHRMEAFDLPRPRKRPG